MTGLGYFVLCTLVVGPMLCVAAFSVWFAISQIRENEK